MKKLKTKAQLDRAANLRLLKTYNISLADYERLFDKERGECWICCKSPLTGRRLHVDHDHSHKKYKIETRFEQKGAWHAWCTYNFEDYYGYGAKKSEAVRIVKRKLLRASVRGLLCWSCNKGLGVYGDSPLSLRSAALYLEKFQSGSPLSGQEK